MYGTQQTDRLVMEEAKMGGRMGSVCESTPWSPKPQSRVRRRMFVVVQMR